MAQDLQPWSSALSLIETFLKILTTSPGAATPISALVKSCFARKHQVEKIQSLLLKSIETAPAENRWIVITCLRAVNILIPFEFSLGENRKCILKAVCDQNLSTETREEAMELLGIVSLRSIVEYFKSCQTPPIPTLQLLKLVKFGIQFPDLTEYKNPNTVKSDDWYLSAIECFKQFSKEDIEAVQSVLLALDSIGDKVESSELILSQIELLDASVRAGFPLSRSCFKKAREKILNIN